MKTYVLLPARYGSSRFSGKPLCRIAGKFMIQHVYERARSVSGVDRVVVATDDQRIFDRVIEFGGEVVMTRKEHPSGTDRLAEAIDLLGVADQDLVVNVQGDQPAFDPRQIAQVIEPLLRDSSLHMSTPIIKTTDPSEIQDPNHVKVVFDRNMMALYFSRAPIPWPREGGAGEYYKHIGIYAYRASFLRLFVKLSPGILENLEKLEQLRALEYGYGIKVVMTDLDSPEVDRPEDVARVEAFLKRL
ncbi:MAG: 3-deoxy-manno-octulosonate cytidylyltransferase [Deltaproteobacteria bacterium]|nr:3-deoxy-manno-octulosonate cytidylyltransferase [Deltaproteobacteria bacterium]